MSPPTVPTVLYTESNLGLSSAEAARLLAEGKGNTPLKKSTRSVAQIVADNVFTYFNLVNVVLAAIVLAVSIQQPKYLRNLLFMGVVLSNTIIGIIQEIRAKRTIDKLSILTEPRAKVIRDGQICDIEIAEIVPGDALLLESGMQIGIDGKIYSSDSLEVDESLLTGESDAVQKQAGDSVFSGSVAMAGSAVVQVEKVSAATLAATITAEAKKEKALSSALMRSLNKLIRVIAFIIFPLGIAIVVKSLILFRGQGSSAVLISTVAVLLSMIPEGLILLTSIAFAVSVIRLGRKKALVQNMSSIESLARTDVLALDKTGTITSGQMELLGLAPFPSDAKICLPEGYWPCMESEINRHLLLLGKEEERSFPRLQDLPADCLLAMQAICRAFPQGNATQQALNQQFSRPDQLSPREEAGGKDLHSGKVDTDNIDTCEKDIKICAKIPFSSQRKWSGISLPQRGSYVVGAAEKIFDPHILEQILPAINKIASLGLRVTVLAHSPLYFPEAKNNKAQDLPAELVPMALLVIADQIRSDAASTFDYFRKQAVTLKIISGDSPVTVEAIARRAGITEQIKSIDMSRFSESEDLREIAENYELFGRVSPFQKRSLLKALQENGHIVTMTGDGVNDVLALKNADCAVAMASGSEAARAAADIVLLGNNMSVMVDAVYEGRRVVNNIQRVATLFLVKTCYASIYAFLMLFMPLSYPIFPIQATLINALTVGLPSFVLALKANKERVSGDFVSQVLPKALPSGIGAVVMLLLLQVIDTTLKLTRAEVATLSMTVLLTVGLRALLWACYPFDRVKALLFVFSSTATVISIGFFPGLFLLARVEGSSLLLYILITLVLTLALTQGLYKLFSSSFFRQKHKLIRQAMARLRLP